MTMSACKVLFWVEEFKNNWLPKNIPHDHDLIGLLINKINELEHILTRKRRLLGKNEKFSMILPSLLAENTPNVNESSDIDECQPGPENTSHPNDVPIPTVLSNHTDEDIENQELFARPAIRIKRIPLDEAELYLPDEWKLGKQILFSLEKSPFPFLFSETKTWQTEKPEEAASNPCERKYNQKKSTTN